MRIRTHNSILLNIPGEKGAMDVFFLNEKEFILNPKARAIEPRTFAVLYLSYHPDDRKFFLNYSFRDFVFKKSFGFGDNEKYYDRSMEWKKELRELDEDQDS